jgi:putative nucleotidyltransferase with HDIG domain
MTAETFTRAETWDLLCEYTQSDALRKHALAVEAAMRHYAGHFGEDTELWGRVGLIHDFDYEQHPTADEHPYKGAEILRERGWPEEHVRCIMSHADYTGIPRETLMAKTLFAVDELCGFLTAVALVRPSKKIAEVEVKSVKKKMKQKAFAAQVNRDDIRNGAELLNLELDEHIGHVLTAMQGIADDLGL